MSRSFSTKDRHGLRAADTAKIQGRTYDQDTGGNRNNRRDRSAAGGGDSRPKRNARLVTEAATPGSSVSLVARRNGISSSLLFRWRRLMEQGELESLGADEQVVPAVRGQAVAGTGART